jgi:hypothetical protein
MELWLYKKHFIVNTCNNYFIWFEILKKDNWCAAGVYACLWWQCDFESADSNEVMKHVNLHLYHIKINFTGFNNLAYSALPISDKHSSCTWFTHLLESASGNA